MRQFGFLACLAIACSSTGAFADEPVIDSNVFSCTTVQFTVRIVQFADDSLGYRATNLHKPGPDFVLNDGTRDENDFESTLYRFKNGTYEYVVVNARPGNEPYQLLVYNNGKQILKQYCKTTSGSES